ncbi:MAG TPA: hypothetical protein VJG32_21030 [Anaerolineae bacterium]|nr:hypothetical protein [Anaerolineae bacterium]
MSFPRDHYTPFGYLDLPRHARRLHPLGVLRSDSVGFAWHYPAYAGGYGGRKPHYIAGFRISIGGALDIEDFDEIACPYHSKNIVEFRVCKDQAEAVATFHPIGDHALRCRLEVQGAGRTRIAIHAHYQRWIAATGAWGESGLVGKFENGRLVLLSFEGGESFVVESSVPASDGGLSADPMTARAWKDQAAPQMDSPLTVIGKSGERVAVSGVLGFEIELNDRPQIIEIVIARGLTSLRAQAELSAARSQANSEEARLRADDARFWQTAPRLEGDWPEHWRRGLVYDLETVRMMVKPPLGIYRRVWDAMQIQAPRVVLAETAIDALLLAYADPLTAAELLLGVFADAPEPNVPCSREDGSYNMVSADGAACGTAPAWGYPWLALAHVMALQPDRAWLERLYPYLTIYLDWWLAHRRDAEGWLAYACSWESGQDNSPRFGEQPLGGGHPTWHVRPADLQASFAHAAQVMRDIAAVLGYDHDTEKWSELAVEFARRTDQLWNGTRYADHDTQQRGLTSVDDIMLLAPVALDVARPERAAALRTTIEAIDADELTWPMLAWTATEAALNVGARDRAAALAGAVCERVYRFWDARQREEGRTSPGVACEYWPLNGRCGGEGYGWGAFTTHLIMHTLIGLSFSATGVALRPNLPLDWRAPGRRYSLRWHIHNQPLVLTLEPQTNGQVRVTVNDHTTEAAWGERFVIHEPWRRPPL